MITKELVPYLERLTPYFQPEMLMLGRQSNTSGWKFPCPYTTLDPDGGDLRIDLNEVIDADGFDVLDKQHGRFQTVFNLGTLEHVWDAHSAYTNAARILKLGGIFINHAPVAGFEGHGVHITSAPFITSFFVLNGFEVLDMFFTTQAGNQCGPPVRNGGKSIVQWIVARRKVLVDWWRKPSQVYVDGRKNDA